MPVLHHRRVQHPPQLVVFIHRPLEIGPLDAVLGHGQPVGLVIHEIGPVAAGDPLLDAAVSGVVLVNIGIFFHHVGVVAQPGRKVVHGERGKDIPLVSEIVIHIVGVVVHPVVHLAGENHLPELVLELVGDAAPLVGGLGDVELPVGVVAPLGQSGGGNAEHDAGIAGIVGEVFRLHRLAGRVPRLSRTELLLHAVERGRFVNGIGVRLPVAAVKGRGVGLDLAQGLESSVSIDCGGQPGIRFAPEGVVFLVGDQVLPRRGDSRLDGLNGAAQAVEILDLVEVARAVVGLVGAGQDVVLALRKGRRPRLVGRAGVGVQLKGQACPRRCGEGEAGLEGDGRGCHHRAALCPRGGEREVDLGGHLPPAPSKRGGEG